MKNQDEAPASWTRTTIMIREDHLEKFKILAWWENKTIKELFNEMIEEYLSSKAHLSRLVEERKKSNPVS